MRKMFDVVRSVSFRAALKLILLAIPLLALVTWRVVAMEANEVEESMIAEGKLIATSGAAAYGSVLDLGLRADALKLDELLNPKYTPIVFPPELHVEESRYHTQFDGWIETSGAQQIEDAIKNSSPHIFYAVGADLGAYVPVTHAEFSQKPTGDTVRDRKFFRSKRKFNLPMHISASLWEGHDPLVQEYHRDTGDMAWDIAAPVYVHDPVTGKAYHFGCFRIGIKQDQIAISRNRTIVALIKIFSVFSAVLALFMFWSLRRTMRPLVELSEKALDISIGGAGISTPIRSSRRDEIGNMTKSLERLRYSLSKAIARID